MLTEKEISERNGYLIALLNALDLGIHVVNFPHKPKLLSADYEWCLSGYVRNFHLILNPEEYTKKVVAEIKLKPIEKMGDLQEIKSMFLDWMVNNLHKRIYTIVNAEAKMFVTGFNHHNKILKKNPYPVFARYDPIIYFDRNEAENVVEAFNQYELKIN